MNWIDYTVTVGGASTTTSETIETLATEKSNVHITGYTVEYRDFEEELRLHIWCDFPDEDDPDTHYDKLNTVLSNLPVSVPLRAEHAPILHYEQSGKTRGSD